MTEIPLEIFLQSMIHPLKINVGWILASLGSNWIRFGSLSVQYKKILERVRCVRRAMPSVLKTVDRRPVLSRSCNFNKLGV